MKLTYSVNEQEKARGKTKESKFYVDNGWTEKTTDLAEFLEHAAVKGNAVCSGVLTNGHRCNDNFRKFCTVIVDVDNKGSNTMSFDEAMENKWLQDTAVCMWSSPNDGRYDPSNGYNGQDRLRILFKLKEDLRICDKRFNSNAYRNDVAKVKRLIDTLHHSIDGGDDGMAWSNCIFGTIDAAKVHTFNEENVLDVDTLGLDSVVNPASGRKPQSQSSFNGTTEQSVANIRDKFLPSIPSDSHEVWKRFGAMLGNIAFHDLDEQVCLDLYQEWAAKDYPETNAEENERIFYLAFNNPGTGSSFSSLKALAMEYGYEPKEFEPEQPVDPIQLFGTGEGYKAGDAIQKARPPGLTVSADDKIFVTDQRGKTHDVTYAISQNLMVKHLIPTLEAVTNAHEYRYNTATMGVVCDGVEMSGEELDNIQYSLSREYGINFPRGTKSALTTIAMANPYDPYKEELERIKKTVTPIDIFNLATRYFKSTTALADVMLEKWLVGLVERLLQPGLPLRGALVVVGKQYIGKDGFINTLVNGDGRILSVGSKSNFKDVNFMLACSTAWVANLDEIERVTRHQLEGELKSWLTQTEDRFTVKYKMYSKTFPRRFSIYGSCNHPQFLQDPTGNTRYWVIMSPLDWEKKGERVDLKRLAEERDGILAGAIALFRQFQQGNYQIELDHAQSVESEAFNMTFVEDAAFVDQLGTFLDGRTTTCMAEIEAVLEMDLKAKADKRLTNQINLSLEQLGWTKLKSPRKIRKAGFKEFSTKLIVKDPDEVNPQELFEFYKKRGQRWYMSQPPTERDF